MATLKPIDFKLANTASDVIAADYPFIDNPERSQE